MTPVTVKCSNCDHQWIGLYLPMPISDAAKVMKNLTCPQCACTKIMIGDGIKHKGQRNVPTVTDKP